MALLLIEGFEQYTIGDSPELARGGWAANTTLNNSFYILKAGRHAGGQGIELALNGGNLFHPIPATDVVTVGFAYRMVDAGPSAQTFLNLRNGLIDHLGLVATVGGELRLNRGVTQIDITSGLGLTQNIWYYFEIDATIHNSTGAYEVRLDGATILSDTGVDTQNAGDAVVDNIEFLGNSATDNEFDDIYVLDDAGTDNTGLLGDCRVETVFPDALGNENDFTASPAVDQHLNVDDGVTPDDDTTYNWSATATDRELYGFAALTGNVGTVFGVDAKMLCRKEDAGFREVRVIARSNITEVESGNLTLGVDYIYKNNIYENDPNGGINWTETSVNAAQFGIDLQT
jgi:hypothetical protein